MECQEENKVFMSKNNLDSKTEKDSISQNKI